MSENKLSVAAAALALALSASGCATYHYAQDIKMAGYDEEPTKGKAVGPIRGADCTWMILGYWLGGQPTLDRAMANARTQSGESITAEFDEQDESQAIRYMNGVSTEWDGFNAYIVGKQCLVVKGGGFK